MYSSNGFYDQQEINTGRSTKTERRFWNKSNKDFNLEYPDQETLNENQKRYEEYLFNLHLNNQIIKSTAKKDKNEEKLEKLEEGFSLYVNGAHKTSEKFTPRHTITKSNDKKSFFKPRIHYRKNQIDNTEFLNALTNREKSQSAPAMSSRKKWSNSSFTIKTADGYEIKINAPNNMKENVSKSDVTNTNTAKKKNNSKGKRTQSEFYYSDDFENESDSEQNDKLFEKQSNHVDQGDQLETEENRKCLIKSVKFSDISDESEIEEEIDTNNANKPNENNKKLSLKLTSQDIKKLRQSINEMNLSVARDSLAIDQSIEEEIEEENEFSSKTNPSKSGFMYQSKLTTKRSNEKIDEVEDDFEDSSNETSSAYELVLKNVANLKQNELENLVDFLAKIDKKMEDTNMEKTRKNKF